MWLYLAFIYGDACGEVFDHGGTDKVCFAQGFCCWLGRGLRVGS